ncbi:hypothetical protein [Rhizobium sp. RU36D]|uniref:hypothetical protein n=1 Tax=Rhizobium sp. RU36D TaxID=1907415 RepID=UPI0009D90938|nr:hypothetical protein [Rhizobium sp. RU36D]SMD16376.1 hypothetical protein SAMN05880593_12967 [Rhizobium sp. RU36D]
MSLFGPLQEIAVIVAIDSKASGIDDLGCFRAQGWSLTDAEWDAVCAEAERLLPIVKVPREVQAEWAAANREFRAEQAADQRAVYGGSF